jgi:septal ring factor EnvC (AmiA/AmiB activator)
MMLGGSGIWLGALAILLLVFTGYVWYSNNRIEHLAAQVAAGKAQLAVQEATINSMKTQAEDQKRSVEALQGKMSTAESEQAKIIARIRNFDIILNARQNRTQTQQRLNTDLGNMFQSLQETSRAPK